MMARIGVADMADIFYEDYDNLICEALYAHLAELGAFDRYQVNFLEDHLELWRREDYQHIHTPAFRGLYADPHLLDQLDTFLRQ